MVHGLHFIGTHWGVTEGLAGECTLQFLAARGLSRNFLMERISPSSVCIWPDGFDSYRESSIRFGLKAYEILGQNQCDLIWVSS